MSNQEEQKESTEASPPEELRQERAAPQPTKPSKVVETEEPLEEFIKEKRVKRQRYDADGRPRKKARTTWPYVAAAGVGIGLVGLIAYSQMRKSSKSKEEVVDAAPQKIPAGPLMNPPPSDEEAAGALDDIDDLFN